MILLQYMCQLVGVVIRDISLKVTRLSFSQNHGQVRCGRSAAGRRSAPVRTGRLVDRQPAELLSFRRRRPTEVLEGHRRRRVCPRRSQPRQARVVRTGHQPRNGALQNRNRLGMPDIFSSINEIVFGLQTHHECAVHNIPWMSIYTIDVKDARHVLLSIKTSFNALII